MRARPPFEIGASAMKNKLAIALMMAIVAGALIVPDHEALAQRSGRVGLHRGERWKRPPSKPPCPAYAMTVLYGCMY